MPLEMIPFIPVIIIAIVWIIVILVAVFTGKGVGTGGEGFHHQPTIPDHHVPEPPQPAGYHDDRSLAEKFDGRLTNVFRNFWEDVL